MLGDVGGQAAQGLEDLVVVLVVRTQLEAVAVRDLEGDFEDVDRVEAEAVAEQRRGGVDLGRRGLKVERVDEKLRELALI